MDDPVKILYRYKNNSQRIQYNMYIFVGNIPATIKKILIKIQKLSLFDSMIALDKVEYAKLVKYYGNDWYTFFFNHYHIDAFLNSLDKAAIKSKITKIHGNALYTQLVSKKKPYIKRKAVYSYELLVKTIKQNEALKNKLTLDYDADYGDDDFFTGNKQMSNLLDIPMQDGGNLSKVEDIDSENIDEQNVDEDFDDTEDLSELEDIYKQINEDIIDENINKTSNLIKEALNDKNIIKKNESVIEEFDGSKLGINYHEPLENIFKKQYIFSQYLYKNDSIDMIKKKICGSMYLNSAFGKNEYLIPTRQYLFSEYYFEKSKNFVMIGQKWIKRTNLLKINIVPEENIRHYEDIKGVLVNLRDSLRRYGNKIKRDDDNNNILADYDRFYTNNEIYLMDIYSDLGKDYSASSESLKNISEVYFKIYYPLITSDDIKNVIKFVNGDKSVESNKNNKIYESIRNDLISDNYITGYIEKVKQTENIYKYTKQNYITQSVIHTKIQQRELSHSDLYKIFNEFEINEQYPFIQYQRSNGEITFKYSEDHLNKLIKIDNNNVNIITKWFENAPYGISVKVKLKNENNKFMGIGITESGKIEYKTQWKETDKATFEDINETYNYVKNLIIKINNEDNKIIFDIPTNDNFEYAFINSIQKFVIPSKINHNDFSNFARFFYPYVSLVIEPRKRQALGSSSTQHSKYGTYLRYKKISKYDNIAKINQRIIYIMRNYEYTMPALINAVSVQFNMTIEQAKNTIEALQKDIGKIKKSRKILKDINQLSKYKPSGIDIGVQGKEEDKYKIKISGARDERQLKEISTFMSTLLYLYVDTYINKNPDRQHLKETLKKLTHIAKRRNKVAEFVKHEKTNENIKLMAKKDKSRIGFTPDPGFSHWSRLCQNSSKKRRQPLQYLDINELMAQGYSLNKKTNFYEKSSTKIVKGKREKVILKALELKSNNDTDRIYYTCTPQNNGEYVYIGVLSKSRNPSGEPMPCCFKKDIFKSNNIQRKNMMLQAIGSKTKLDDNIKIPNNLLYILQNTMKLYKNRLAFLSEYLDILFNKSLNKKINMKNNYLQTTAGYFFKYGVDQLNNPFINSIAEILNTTSKNIIKKCIDALNNDKTMSLFTSLNGGVIRKKFNTSEEYIKFILKSDNLDYSTIGQLIVTPGVLNKLGYNIIIFKSKKIKIMDSLEKTKYLTDYVLETTNINLHNITDSNMETFFLINDNNNYSPIILVKKNNSSHKFFDKHSIFKYKEDKSNIINHLYDFFSKNNINLLQKTGMGSDLVTNTQVVQYLQNMRNKDYLAKYQVIDSQFKCVYIVTNNSTIIPTLPSPVIHNISILSSVNKKLLPYEKHMAQINKLIKLLKSDKTNDFNFNIKGVIYSNRTNSKLDLVALITNSDNTIPLEKSTVLTSAIPSNHIIKKTYLKDSIDKKIINNKIGYIDDRIASLRLNEYKEESYELFRLELSKYLNKDENTNVKKKILNIMKNKKLSKDEKKIKYRHLLYAITDKHLLAIFKEKYEQIQKGGGYNKLIQNINNIPNTDKYQISNTRRICDTLNDKQCANNIHCKIYNNKCYFAVTKKELIKYITKISEELSSEDIKAFEILQMHDYFVSDIINYNIYDKKDNQKIVKSINANIEEELKPLFGDNRMPLIGRVKPTFVTEQDYIKLNEENRLKKFGDSFIQNIIQNNISTIRGYVNGYIWLKQNDYNTDVRNLGYYSVTQTKLANLFNANIIVWLSNTSNVGDIKNNIKYFTEFFDKENIQKSMIDYVNNSTKNIANINSGIVELHILSKMHDIPVIIYNEEDKIQYVFIDGIKYSYLINSSKNIPKFDKFESINMRYIYGASNDVPEDIEVIYY